MSMLEFLERGQVARDVRLMAAQAAVDVTANEQLSILVRLLKDDDEMVRTTALATLARLPQGVVDTFLNEADVADEVRAHFVTARAASIATAEATPAASPVESLDVDAAAEPPPELVEEGKLDRESILQKLAKMSYSERLKAAAKGSREVRAILVRDPSKMITMAVLASPKLTEPEVASFARMGNVSEDVLRTIGANRSWMKNYGVVLALVKNAKTPVALSMNLMQRLNDRDLAGLSTDRNVPEPLRVAARKKVISAVSR